MAILAEVDNLLHHQIFMTAAMRRVADRAILRNRRVLPDKGTPFVGVTLVAELVDALGLEHMFCQGAVGIVAIGALDLAFDDGMVRELVGV